MSEPSRRASEIAETYLDNDTMYNQGNLADAIDSHASEMVAEERRRCVGEIQKCIDRWDGTSQWAQLAVVALREAIYFVEGMDRA
jgi:hypothetical protein